VFTAEEFDPETKESTMTASIANTSSCYSVDDAIMHQTPDSEETKDINYSSILSAQTTSSESDSEAPTITTLAMDEKVVEESDVPVTAQSSSPLLALRQELRQDLESLSNSEHEDSGAPTASALEMPHAPVLFTSPVVPEAEPKAAAKKRSRSVDKTESSDQHRGPKRLRVTPLAQDEVGAKKMSYNDEADEVATTTMSDSDEAEETEGAALITAPVAESVCGGEPIVSIACAALAPSFVRRAPPTHPVQSSAVVFCVLLEPGTESVYIQYFEESAVAERVDEILKLHYPPYQLLCMTKVDRQNIQDVEDRIEGSRVYGNWCKVPSAPLVDFKQFLHGRPFNMLGRIPPPTLPKLSVDSAEQLLGTLCHVTPNNPTQTPTTADANRTPTELPIAASTLPDIPEQTLLSAHVTQSGGGKKLRGPRNTDKVSFVGMDGTTIYVEKAKFPHCTSSTESAEETKSRLLANATEYFKGIQAQGVNMEIIERKQLNGIGLNTKAISSWWALWIASEKKVL